MIEGQSILKCMVLTRLNSVSTILSNNNFYLTRLEIEQEIRSMLFSKNRNLRNFEFPERGADDEAEQTPVTFTTTRNIININHYFFNHAQ